MNSKLTLRSIAIYVIGRSKEVGGKFVVPALVLVHAFFSVFVGWAVSEDPRQNLAKYIEQGVLAMTLVPLTPLVVLLQMLFQYWEMRKRDDLGALSLRSFCLQAGVMMMLTLRFIVRVAPPPWYDSRFGDTQPEDFVARILWWFQWYLLSCNSLGWVVGACTVWFLTVRGRERKGKGVELGVFLT